MLKVLLISVTALLLGGCQTLDLSAGEGNLNPADRDAAVKMGSLISTKCVRSSSYGTGQPTYTSKIQTKAVVTRLWIGGHWYRALGKVDGVADYFYLNQIDGRFTCGELTWQKDPESRFITFVDVLNLKHSASARITSGSGSAATKKMVPAMDGEPLPADTSLEPKSGVEARLMKFKKLYDSGLITELEYKGLRAKALEEM